MSLFKKIESRSFRLQGGNFENEVVYQVSDTFSFLLSDTSGKLGVQSVSYCCGSIIDFCVFLTDESTEVISERELNDTYYLDLDGEWVCFSCGEFLLEKGSAWVSLDSINLFNTVYSWFQSSTPPLEVSFITDEIVTYLQSINNSFNKVLPHEKESFLKNLRKTVDKSLVA